MHFFALEIVLSLHFLNVLSGYSTSGNSGIVPSSSGAGLHPLMRIICYYSFVFSYLFPSHYNQVSWLSCVLAAPLVSSPGVREYRLCCCRQERSWDRGGWPGHKQ